MRKHRRIERLAARYPRDDAGPVLGLRVTGVTGEKGRRFEATGPLSPANHPIDKPLKPSNPRIRRAQSGV
jgi:hypothetical protein